jgi:hypothetical protein
LCQSLPCRTTTTSPNASTTLLSTTAQRKVSFSSPSSRCVATAEEQLGRSLKGTMLVRRRSR